MIKDNLKKDSFDSPTMKYNMELGEYIILKILTLIVSIPIYIMYL